MPLYDSGSLISDKQCFIIDIGTKYTKFGFSGEASPRCIIPTEVVCSDTGELRQVFEYKDSDDFRILMTDFIQMLFLRYALIHPKEKRVVIVESLLCPTLIRETLASVLFEHFEVTSVLFVSSHAVTLHTLGIGTGLVTDVGAQEAVLIPVYEGIPALFAWQALPIGSKVVEKNLYNLLSGKVKQINEEGTQIVDDASTVLTDKILEDIKVKGCFVTTLERAKIIAEGKVPKILPPSFNYEIGGNKVINIEPEDRELPYEILFERDVDDLSLSTMILDAILLCPLDMRKRLAENIVLIGGTVMATGFKSRLKEELLSLLKTPKYSQKLYFKTFKFHSLPAKENYAAWLGGSICGATDMILTKSITKEAYLEMKRVADWSDLLSNKLESAIIA